jgi:GTPase Era involved in 16S rRNA processing
MNPPPTNTEIDAISEKATRQLRAAIYGEVSDESWAKVRENWMKPENVRWLQERQPRVTG